MFLGLTNFEILMIRVQLLCNCIINLVGIVRSEYCVYIVVFSYKNEGDWIEKGQKR